MTPEEIQEAMTLFHSMTAPAILKCALFGECRGEPIEGQVGVGSVIRERKLVKGVRYNDIILAPAQFSAFFPGDPNFQKLLNLEGYEDPDVLRQLAWVAEGIVSGSLRDNVARANHYYDFSIIVGQGQQRDPSRLVRYLRAVDTIILDPEFPATVQEIQAARDLIHTLVAPLPPRWDNEVLPCARKGRIVFFRL